MGAGIDRNDANQQFLLDDSAVTSLPETKEGGTVSMSDLDPQLLATLTEKQQKKLLKMYKHELRALGDHDGSSPHRERSRAKHKKKRKREKDSRKKRRRERSEESSRSGSDS